MTMYISNDDVKKIVTCKDAINITKQAFCDYKVGKSKMPKKIYLDLPEFNGDFRAMPAYDERYQIAGIKWVNSHVHQKKTSIPSVQAMMLINNPETGEHLATLEAGYLTSLRTGAAGALSAQYLCDDEDVSVGFIGCGMQAFFQLMCLQEIKHIATIFLYDKQPQTVSSFLDLIKSSLHHQPTIIPCSSVFDVAHQSRILITTTPVTKPVVVLSDLLTRPVLINAIGADASGKQELDHAILQEATIVVDDIKQACYSGEINTAITEKKLKIEDVKVTLADVILNSSPLSSEPITVFDSTGLAVQDLALAGFVYKNMSKAHKN